MQSANAAAERERSEGELRLGLCNRLAGTTAIYCQWFSGMPTPGVGITF